MTRRPSRIAARRPRASAALCRRRQRPPRTSETPPRCAVHSSRGRSTRAPSALTPFARRHRGATCRAWRRSCGAPSWSGSLTPISRRAGADGRCAGLVARGKGRQSVVTAHPMRYPRSPRHALRRRSGQWSGRERRRNRAEFRRASACCRERNGQHHRRCQTCLKAYALIAR